MKQNYIQSKSDTYKEYSIENTALAATKKIYQSIIIKKNFDGD